MNSLNFRGFDLTLAVSARRTLLFETHTNEERAELVWEPTREWLDTLARASLPALTLLAGKPYRFPKGSGGRCVDLYAASPARQVAYLGTVFSERAERADRAWLVTRYQQTSPAQARMLSQRPLLTITRNHTFCKIPVPGERLDRKVLVGAARRYLQAFAPALSHLSLRWLPRDEGAELDKEIRELARETAQPASEEERVQKLADDITEV